MIGVVVGRNEIGCVDMMRHVGMGGCITYSLVVACVVFVE